eukprot:GHVT01019928.1.p1 GENE.GHVT01019928.1~~GHVT01019928.1.p1  ORF type:complete len:299 (-),score=74.22 GHVT01019928.1:909-1805(-)
MTLLHAATCVLLAFGPYYAIYKGSNLTEQTGVHILLLVSAAGYLVTQLCKSLLIVSLFPESAGEDASLFDHAIEAVVNLVDVGGMYYTLQNKRMGRHMIETRLLCVGMGWAFAESIAGNLFAFILNSREMEFTWSLIIRALAANVTLLSNLMVCRLLSMLTRSKSFAASPGVLTTLLLILAVGTPSANRYLRHEISSVSSFSSSWLSSSFSSSPSSSSSASSSATQLMSWLSSPSSLLSSSSASVWLALLCQTVVTVAIAILVGCYASQSNKPTTTDHPEGKSTAATSFTKDGQEKAC